MVGAKVITNGFRAVFLAVVFVVSVIGATNPARANSPCVSVSVETLAAPSTTIALHPRASSGLGAVHIRGVNPSYLRAVQSHLVELAEIESASENHISVAYYVRIQGRNPKLLEPHPGVGPLTSAAHPALIVSVQVVVQQAPAPVNPC